MGHTLRQRLAAPLKRAVGREDRWNHRLDSTLDRMADKAGDRAHDLADRLGEQAHKMADRFNERAHVAADEAKTRSRRTMKSGASEVMAVGQTVAAALPLQRKQTWRTVNVGPRERIFSVMAGLPLVLMAARGVDLGLGTNGLGTADDFGADGLGAKASDTGEAVEGRVKGPRSHAKADLDVPALETTMAPNGAGEPTGLLRRLAGRGALGLIGGEMVYRGVTGHCPIYQVAGVNKVSRPLLAGIR